jgi:hypothetical protein
MLPDAFEDGALRRCAKLARPVSKAARKKFDFKITLIALKECSS